jgi:AcrR family transcriptional regulator
MSRPPDPHAKIDLLRAAEAVFIDEGLDNARVEDITARAGRSKGAFYLHFDSKEDAFRQIVETFLARLATSVEDSELLHSSGAAPADPAEYLALWHEKDVEIFEFVWQNRGLVRLLLEGGGGTEFRYLIDEFAERQREKTKRFLRWGIEQGVYRDDLDLETASLVISGAYDRVARQIIRRERKPDLTSMVGEVQRLLVGGIASSELLETIDSKVRNRRSRRA